MKRKITHITLFILFVFATATATAQNDVERSNQIVKELLPDEKILVHTYGIEVDEVVLYFEKEQPELPLITVSEEDLHLHLCCVAVISFENEETLEGEITQLSAYSYPLESAQLPLAKELKTLIESIRSGK